MSADPLLDELAARAELFPPELGGDLRTWFTRRILAHLRAGPPPHDDREDALAAIALARTLAANCSAELNALDDTDAKVFFVRDLAVRAAYGAMGVHPAELLREDRADYLLFIVKRRVFAVDRMTREVPDGFRYPDGPVLLSQPSLQARPFWTGVTQIPPGSVKRYPFVLSSPAGTADPLGAVTRLFEPNAVRANRSAFDCAGAAMAVNLAALLDAAADPAALATALANGGGPYFTLDHPHGSSGVVGGELVQGVTPILLADAPAGSHVELTVAFAWITPPAGSLAQLVTPDHEESVTIDTVEQVGSRYTGKVIIEQLAAPAPAGSRIVPAGRPALHLVTDTGANSLFEQVFVPDDELQIGDHVYVASHPMHRALLSDVSVWGGEHAFVCDVPVSRRDTMVVSGHGVAERQLRAAMDKQVLVDANTALDIFREVVRRQLTNPPAVTWSGPPAQLTNADQFASSLRRQYEEPPTSAVSGTCRVYEYPGVTFQRDDESVPHTSPRYLTMTFEGTVGSAAVDQHAFVLYRWVNAAAANDWSMAYNALARSDTVNAGRQELERFGIYYRDDTQGYETVFLPLYHTDAQQRSGARRLRYDDVIQTLYGGPEGTAFVIRPRVVADESGSYRAHLRQKGALPAAP